MVDSRAAAAYVVGELMFEVAPADLADDEAADCRGLFCEQIG
ncbi:hypothetical protein ACIQ9Q_40415 [Streptomyces sp. NPDC094438]